MAVTRHYCRFFSISMEDKNVQEITICGLGNAHFSFEPLMQEHNRINYNGLF